MPPKVFGTSFCGFSASASPASLSSDSSSVFLLGRRGLQGRDHRQPRAGREQHLSDREQILAIGQAAPGGHGAVRRGRGGIVDPMRRGGGKQRLGIVGEAGHDFFPLLLRNLLRHFGQRARSCVTSSADIGGLTLDDVRRRIEPLAAALDADQGRDQPVLGEREFFRLEVREAPVVGLMDRPGRAIELAGAAEDAGRMPAVERHAVGRAGEADRARRAQLLAQQAALADLRVEGDAAAQPLGRRRRRSERERLGVRPVAEIAGEELEKVHRALLTAARARWRSPWPRPR